LLRLDDELERLDPEVVHPSGLVPASWSRPTIPPS
jgi:hypothetical protein